MLGVSALLVNAYAPKTRRHHLWVASTDEKVPLSTFAANLKAVIGKRSVNSWAKAHELTQTTINRIVNGKLDPTSRQIELIAERAGLFPYQLMVPNIDPQNPPVLREASDMERQLYQKLKQTIEELAELREGGSTVPGAFDEIKGTRFDDAKRPGGRHGKDDAA
jgi:hypothetical protein